MGDDFNHNNDMMHFDGNKEKEKYSLNTDKIFHAVRSSNACNQQLFKQN
jgi:hypothetical protein